MPALVHGEPLAQPRDRAARAVRSRLGQHHGELAVAVAGDEIGQPELAPQPGADLLPRPRIRLGIGRSSVRRLDAEQHQAEAERVAPRPLELLLQPAVERRRGRAARAGRWPPSSARAATSARLPASPSWVALSRGADSWRRMSSTPATASSSMTGRTTIAGLRPVPRRGRRPSTSGAAAPDRLADLGVAVQIEWPVLGAALGDVGDDAAFVLARPGDHEGAVRQVQRAAEPAHERQRDLVRVEQRAGTVHEIAQALADPRLVGPCATAPGGRESAR